LVSGHERGEDGALWEEEGGSLESHLPEVKAGLRSRREGSVTVKYVPMKEFMIVEEVKKESSIVIPENEKQYVDDQVFRVVTLPVESADVPFKVGDQVVIVGYLTHFKHAGKKLTLAKSKDVIMVIGEDADAN
jgi:co-chaperonin GroES (HSP10)